MSSSKRARRRRRHAKYGVPRYSLRDGGSRKPRTGRRVDYAIIDEVPAKLLSDLVAQAGDGAK